MDIVCPVCKNVVIWVNTPRGYVKTKDYSETHLYLSNQTICVVALCRGCMDGKKETDAQIISWLKESWKAGGGMSQKQTKGIDSLEILASGSDKLEVEKDDKLSKLVKHGTK